MKGTLLAIMAAIAAYGIIDGTATAQPVDKTPTYETFRLVRTRNIFDPSRRATRGDSPGPQRSYQPQRGRSGAGSNGIVLTGAMVTEHKSLAFFSSGRAEYNKVISVGERVADFKVTGISPAQVELERNGSRIVLSIGRQLTLEGSVAEASDAGPAPPAPEESSDTTTAAPGPAAAAPSPTDDKNDILRRMIERRQKEMSK
jgi:hypothetical protein